MAKFIIFSLCIFLFCCGTNKNVYNDACNKCHGENKKSKLLCSEKTVLAKTTTIDELKTNINNKKLFKFQFKYDLIFFLPSLH